MLQVGTRTHPVSIGAPNFLISQPSLQNNDFEDGGGFGRSGSSSSSEDGLAVEQYVRASPS